MATTNINQNRNKPPAKSQDVNKRRVCAVVVSQLPSVIFISDLNLPLFDVRREYPKNYRERNELDCSQMPLTQVTELDYVISNTTQGAIVK